MLKKKNNGVIIGLAALLLLVVVASAAVLWFLPAAPPLTVEPGVDINQTPEASGFDLKLFNRSQYQTLNFQLITSGSLPVKPPATPGKANPFL